MPTSELFTTDFKTTPYWWDAMASWDAPVESLPTQADVVIVGAGLTGSSAAATLGRAGYDVVMVDAQFPGFGASARSAGFLSRHFKHSLRDLLKKFGPEKAKNYFDTLQNAYDFTLDLIRSENLECHLQENGRFIAAMNQPDFDVLKHEYALRQKHLNEAFTILENGGQSEYCSDRVVGGVLLQDQASIHPGVYIQSMARRAQTSGAQLFCQTHVNGIEANSSGFMVQTSRGPIQCAHVLVATNGYSDDGVKWAKRSVVPIRGYQIATEPLPESLLNELLPFNRTYTDRRNASNYLRPSPDGTRLLFGGQTGALLEDDMTKAAVRVRKEMVDLFPALRNVQLSHAWSGRCAATIDMFPKVGLKNGIHFAMAYCFSGNVLAPYFGHHVAQKIMGQQPASIPFETQKLRTIPLYTGNAWFVPMVQKYYEFLDRIR